MKLLIRLIKWIISGFLYYTRLLSLFEFIKERIYGRRFIILYYHVITNTKEGKVDYFKPQMAISIESFRREMDFLRKNYNVVSLEDLIYAVKQNKMLPPKALVITFDDGYADNYTNAYPILKENKLPATIFLATDYIQTNKLLWFDQVHQAFKNYDDLSKIKIPEGECDEDLRAQLLKIFAENLFKPDEAANLVTSLIKRIDRNKRDTFIKYLVKTFPPNRQEKPLMLSWDQVAEMNKNGISIQSHTKSHPDLTILSEQEAQIEIIESKQEIERKINKEVTCFAFPDGYFNDKVKTLVSKIGFNCACTTIRGNNGVNSDLFELKRINVSEKSSIGFRNKYSKAIFATELAGIFNCLFLRKLRKW